MEYQCFYKKLFSRKDLKQTNKRLEFIIILNKLLFITLESQLNVVYHIFSEANTLDQTSLIIKLKRQFSKAEENLIIENNIIKISKYFS